MLASEAFSTGSWTSATKGSTTSTQLTIRDLLCSPGLAALVALLFSTLYFCSCLTSSALGGLCRNCSAQLTRMRPWPVPSTRRLLQGLEGPFSAVPRISKNLVAYLAGLSRLIVVIQYFGGTASVVLQILKLATDSNYTDFLNVSLWNGIKLRRSRTGMFLARRFVANLKRSMEMGIHWASGGEGFEWGNERSVCMD